MANFYYVKSGGTATGDAGRVATTRSTGSFATKGAANYYDSITDAKNATTAPVAGDYFMCSHLHNKAHGATHTITPNGVIIVSVDDANCDQYLAGAKETATVPGTSADYLINQSSLDLTIKGMTFEADDRIQFQGDSQRVYLEDCTLHLISASSSSELYFINDGHWAIFKNCELNFSNGSDTVQANNGPFVRFDGVTSTGTKIANFYVLLGSGITRLECINTDLDSLMSTNANLVSSGATIDDGLFVKLRRCKLPSGMNAYNTSGWGLQNFEFDFAECDQGDGYHYFYFEDFRGSAEEDTTTYLTATYDGTNGFSAQLDSGSRAYTTQPFRYKLATLPAQDLTSNKTYEVEFTCDNALTDNDFWIEVERPDATDNALGVIQSSQNADPLATGTTHTTSSATWTSGLTNKYKDSLTVSGMTGVDNANVTIYVCVGKPSETINADPAVTVT